MIPSRIKSFIGHYVYGFFAAGWNGAWNAVAGIAGIDTAAMTGATQDAHLLNAKEMGAAFLGAFVIHAILWIKAHPLPAELPDNDQNPV